MDRVCRDHTLGSRIPFICGVLAAIRFINRKPFLAPLATGIGSILTLFYFTFGQPPITIRVLLDAVLISATLCLHRRSPRK